MSDLQRRLSRVENSDTMVHARRQEKVRHMSDQELVACLWSVPVERIPEDLRTWPALQQREFLESLRREAMA